MATDCSKANESIPGGKHITSLTARLTLYSICLAGLWIVGCAVCSKELDWQVLTVAALCFAISPVNMEMSWAGDRAIKLPLMHSVLFAGAVSLGPWGAVIPAALGGIGKLVFGPPQQRPISHILFVMCKPALACLASSLVYSAVGGNNLRPYSVDLTLPIMLSGAAYIAVSAALTSIVRSAGSGSDNQASSATEVFAGWWMCIIGGYMLAIMFSIAPPYVLLVPAAGVILTHFMLSKQNVIISELQSQIEETPAEEEQPAVEEAPGEMVFIDPATGLANQRYLEMFLQREASRSQRLNKPFAVAVFDVRTSGKEATDEALGEIGKHLKAELRDYDLIARHSSGRLIAVLPESDIDAACEVAERLHPSLSHIKIHGKTINLNIGIAAYPEHADTSDELINAAHYALNTGKFTLKSGVHRCRKLMKAG